MFRVMKKRCDQCLFGPTKIVSDTRKAAILAGIERDDSFFICHKASIADQTVSCRGDHDARPHSLPRRMLAAFKMQPTFVREEDL